MFRSFSLWGIFKWTNTDVPLWNEQSLKAAHVGLRVVSLLLAPVKQTYWSFSLVLILLIITSILDMKWRKKIKQLCNTSDIQSCVSLWKLPNKHLSSPKPAAAFYSERTVQNERTRQYPQLGNEIVLCDFFFFFLWGERHVLHKILIVK